jgi:hypothetical protein
MPKLIVYISKPPSGGVDAGDGVVVGALALPLLVKMAVSSGIAASMSSLLRCAGARTVFGHPLYYAIAAANATMLAMVTKPMNTKAMWRPVVDPPWFHLVNDRQSFVICGIFAGWTLGIFAFRYLNDAM